MLRGNVEAAVRRRASRRLQVGEDPGMKPAGVFLLLAGWGIVLSAVVLFSNELLRGIFVFAGVCLEVLGLAFLFRSYSNPEQESE